MACIRVGKSTIICINPPLDNNEIDKTPADGECGKYHYRLPDLGYLQSAADATERIKRGEQQFQCPICGLYIWDAYAVGESEE